MERYGPGEQQNLVFKNFRPKRSPENTLKNTLKTPIFFFQNMSCGASMERYGPGEQLWVLFKHFTVGGTTTGCTRGCHLVLYYITVKLSFLPSVCVSVLYFEGVPK